MPEFSVLVARVSTAEAHRVLELLAALRRQEGSPSYEVVVGDRLSDDLTGAILRDYPEAVLVRAPATTSLPALRTLAFLRARGTYLAVIGDSCTPDRGWLAAFARVFGAAPASVVAVGGCVLNGSTTTRLGRATFFCEYLPFLPPIPDGVVSALPGMNVCYRREAFAGLEEGFLAGGFWESTLHERWQGEGRLLWSTPEARVTQRRDFTLRRFLVQRFHASRAFAGARFRAAGPAWRTAGVLGAPLLFPLLLLRQARRAMGKPGTWWAWLGCLPYLVCFFGVVAVAEGWGALVGPGRSLSRVE